jgi:hypothetical protein|tara:strand:- start:205 stop:450 length:246 start_codon:yes stop_codon:yes gene_type:complete
MWWFLYGLIMGGGISAIAVNVSLTWYVWLFIVIALIMFTLTMQHYFASIKEMEPMAARRGAVALGTPGVIFAVLAIVLALV